MTKINCSRVHHLQQCYFSVIFYLRYLRTVKGLDTKRFAQKIVLTQHYHRVATVKQSVLVHQDVLRQVTNKLQTKGLMLHSHGYFAL